VARLATFDPKETRHFGDTAEEDVGLSWIAHRAMLNSFLDFLDVMGETICRRENYGPANR
jgi:hypothetical protein